MVTGIKTIINYQMKNKLMKYNIDKAKQIQELETNKKAQDFINDAQEVNKEIVEINKIETHKNLQL